MHSAFRIIRTVIFASTCLCFGGGATAGAFPEVPDSDGTAATFDVPRWTIIVSPYLWAASLSGHTHLGDRRSDVDVPFSQIFRNLDFTFMGNIEATNGLYGAYLDGQYTKTSQSELVHSHNLAIDITSASLSAGAFYRAVEVPLEGSTVFGHQRIFAVEPTVGIRWTKLKADVWSGHVFENRKLEWTDPFIGARVQADLTARWNLFAQADVGGFGVGSDLSVQGQAYLGYRTHIFKRPALLRIGYRALYQDYNGGNTQDHFKWNVTQHGPIAGVSLVF